MRGKAPDRFIVKLTRAERVRWHTFARMVNRDLSGIIRGVMTDTIQQYTKQEQGEAQ